MGGSMLKMRADRKSRRLRPLRPHALPVRQSVSVRAGSMASPSVRRSSLLRAAIRCARSLASPHRPPSCIAVCPSRARHRPLTSPCAALACAAGGVRRSPRPTSQSAAHHTIRHLRQPGCGSGHHSKTNQQQREAWPGLAQPRRAWPPLRRGCSMPCRAGPQGGKPALRRQTRNQPGQTRR